MNTILTLRRYTHELIAHSHDHVQLVFGLNGLLDMEIAGQGGQVRQQTVAVIPDSAHHACGSTTGSDCLVLDVPSETWLSDRLGTRAVDSLRLFERPHVKALAPQQHQLVSWLANSATEDALLAQQGAALLLAALSGTPSASANAPSAWLDQLRLFIDRHLAHPLALTDLARHAGLSPSRLHARFVEATGRPPMAYLRQRRLQQGRQLLIETQLPVGEVAVRVGYASQSAFTAALGREFGVTPRALRQETRDRIRQ